MPGEIAFGPDDKDYVSVHSRVALDGGPRTSPLWYLQHMAQRRRSSGRASRSGRGERKKRWPFVIVANRLPVAIMRGAGTGRWITSPGGLVSALSPIAQRSGGAWVGWTGKAGEPIPPFVHDDIAQIPVALSRTEVRNYYQGFCNQTLWPLFHDAVQEPDYHRHWWRAYVDINERFAEATADAVRRNGAVWVQDYQLLLVPQMLRALRPDLRIGFFLHIPFPPAELFARLPWRRQVLEGILGADVIGFQTERNAQNFRRLIEYYADAKLRANDRASFGGRQLRVSAYPISIDFDRYAGTALDLNTAVRVERLRSQIGGRRKLIVGVDRLDYTKGIDRRLRAFRDLMAQGRITPTDAVLVQVAVPSRERVADYIEMRSRIEELVGQINGEFAEVGMAVVHYLRRSLSFENLIAMYRAADVMTVTPLCDGMNLVAKEYVATRYDDTGALVLSEFAGAAQELRDALLVNPHDVDGIAAAMHQALHLAPDEAATRMRAMRTVVAENTVQDWARRFVSDLVPAALRKKALGA